MGKKVVKPIVLTGIFLLALVTFSLTTNKVNKDLTANMDEASLPVMYFVYNGIQINELHGYTREMDLLSMRDSVLPIGEDRRLNMEFMTYGTEISNLSYQIRSLDGKRLLKEEENVPLSLERGKNTCEIELPSLFDEQQEYNMVLTATVDEKPVYYYTRIMRANGCYVDESLAFAMKFHDYTFRNDAEDFIPTYMDPATGDATTLSYVDLSCTLRQITWANFQGVRLTEAVASFKEINSSYNVITLNYVMTNVNEENEVEYYNIEEYYRLRQTSTRMYVLNFERRMNQIFRGENDFLSGDSAVLLGIRDSAVEYKGNDAGDCLAFVQEGELWCYDRVNNTLSQVFTFRGQEGIDARENWKQYDIEIVRVDEAGSVDFLVYGYMNRGVHEGRVGISVYHYDGIAHTVEEEVFIERDESFEVLKAELGELMYVNEQKELYLTMNEDVYRINLNEFSTEKFIETKNHEGYAISGSDRYVAWVEADKPNNSEVIYMADLKNGQIHEITSGTDTYLKPLAFIGEDFIYGVANQADVKTDNLGNTIFPMHTIEILGISEDKCSVIKSYHPRHGYAGSVTVDAQNIYVNLMKEEEGRFVPAGSDTIMNRETGVENGVTVSTIVTDLKQTQLTLTMKEVNTAGSVKLITPKHVLLDEDRELEMKHKDEATYYVYQKGQVLLATTNVSEAVLCANRNHGVVVDRNMHYIFKRARDSEQKSLKDLAVNAADSQASNLAKSVSALLTREDASLSVHELLTAGQTPYDILQTTLKSARIFELFGCGVDELLYYIDRETPVLAKTGAEDAILLTGYTSSKIYYFDPASETTKTMDYDEAEELFGKGGNYFIVYLK